MFLEVLASIDSTGIPFSIFLGIIFIPRLMILYLGMIQAQSVGAIAAFSFVPRIMICSIISNSLNGESSGAMVFLWIIAVILDIVGFIFRGNLSLQLLKIQMENFSRM